MKIVLAIGTAKSNLSASRKIDVGPEPIYYNSNEETNKNLFFFCLK